MNTGSGMAAKIEVLWLAASRLRFGRRPKRSTRRRSARARLSLGREGINYSAARPRGFDKAINDQMETHSSPVWNQVVGRQLMVNVQAFRASDSWSRPTAVEWIPVVVVSCGGPFETRDALRQAGRKTSRSPLYQQLWKIHTTLERALARVSQSYLSLQ